MVKKTRILRAYRLSKETDKAIRNYAKKRDLSQSKAIDELVASAIIQAKI